MAYLSDDPDRYAYLAEGNATQARKRVAVKVLTRDAVGRVLLVNPTYKDFWDLPGGMAEANEAPTRAAERELEEELNLKLPVGRLLVVDWVGPHDPWDDQLVFVFDGGALDATQQESLSLDDPELSDLAFMTTDEAQAALRPDVHAMLTRAEGARSDGSTSYLERRRR